MLEVSKSNLWVAGTGNREVAMFGGGQCCCNVAIGLSAVAVLRGWDCGTA